jgi:hypothetical protein
MNRPVLLLRDISGDRLKTKAQAQSIIQAIIACAQCWVGLEFSGITELSWEFASEFMYLAEMELPEVWLVPRNYNHSADKLVGALLSRIKRLREQAWRDSYDWMWRDNQ